MKTTIDQQNYALRAPRILGGINRVGHPCKVVPTPTLHHHFARVRFADGHEATLSRWILRRLPDCAIAAPPHGCESGNHVNGH